MQGVLTKDNVGCLRWKAVSHCQDLRRERQEEIRKGLPELSELWRAFSAVIIRRPSC